MPLTFHPTPGTIVICDFSTGFRPPEMVKARPVVVISPRRRTAQLATVVPLPSAAPLPIEPWHYCLPAGAYPPARGPIWVKGDIVTTVALHRLDRVRTKSRDGGRTYLTFQLGEAELAAVLACVRRALGLG
ncbi:MAG TPA: type II toxin-antitoxin system PemK/MazF family toxin [Acetobacteraceae bacterium]|nr:type II toxin-antitoxin system PemK/MazF family toxin [Acetobacteraceae bacterium]